IVDRRGPTLPQVLDGGALRLEPGAGRAPADLHLADVADLADRLVVAAQADGEVVDAVAVEVAGGDGVAELVAGGRRVERVGVGLEEELRSRCGEPGGERRTAGGRRQQGDDPAPTGEPRAKGARGA